jgi:hypothetical protein
MDVAGGGGNGLFAACDILLGYPASHLLYTSANVVSSVLDSTLFSESFTFQVLRGIPV